MSSLSCNPDLRLLLFGVSLFLCFFLVIRLLMTKKSNNTATELDYATGSMTENSFLIHCNRALASKYNFYALVSVQVTNLAKIYQVYGPNEYSRTINYIHHSIKAQLSSDEPLARTGEDSFCFLLKNRKPDEIYARLNRVCDSINRFHSQNPDSITMHMAFGIYLPVTKEECAKEMLAKAVSARLNRPQGRRYHFYDQHLQDRIEWERDFANSVDDALQINEFVVYYQPKVRILDQRIAGMEALVRWRHPQRGLLSPDMFLPLAERYQKIRKIDRFVFEEVCRTLARWKKQSKELCPISVNLASSDLTYSNLADECYEICTQYSVDPSLIEFEVKEHLLTIDPDLIKTLFKRFHSLGFRYAIDNFGADRASLKTLTSLEIDTIKLDRSFFSGDNDHLRGRFIAEAIMKLSSQLRIQTVAEGIENQGQVKYLQQIGCDMIQGFHYFKPMSLDRLEREVFLENMLGFCRQTSSVSHEHSSQKHMTIGRSAHNPKSIIQFSYLPEEDIIQFSEAFSPVLGNQTQFRKARALLRTTELVHENDREDFLHLIDCCLCKDGWVKNTLRFYMADGRYGWLEVHLHHDGIGENRVINGTMINLTEWNNEVNRWKEKATRDALTGLYNREYFEHNVQTQLDQKIHSCAALLFIDVDDFKNVNDSFGHKFGDDVLCYVAKQTLGVFRHTDIVARYGGDEFVVFAPSIKREILEERLEKLCSAFRFPYRNTTVEYKVSITVGVAFYPRDGITYEALLEHADCALYEAKSQGKDRFILYEPHMLGESGLSELLSE